MRTQALAARCAPQWAHEELDRVARQGETGTTGFEHVNGDFVKIRRGEVIAPPRDTLERLEQEGVASSPQICPDDGGPMAEFDYGAKLRCATCGGVASIYELRERWAKKPAR